MMFERKIFQKMLRCKEQDDVWYLPYYMATLL